jgi:hypothetical protein
MFLPRKCESCVEWWWWWSFVVVVVVKWVERDSVMNEIKMERIYSSSARQKLKLRFYG